MIRQLIETFSANNDPAKLRTAIRNLLATNERLRLENAQLRRENRALRRRLADGHLRLLRRAESDSVLIGALHFSGQHTSRRACAAVGLSERRWTWAMALLRLARVRYGARITTEAPEDFERAVRVARVRVERDGIQVLRDRLPLYLQ